MGFVALILALLLEQGKPLPRDNPAHNVVRWLATSVRNATDAGTVRFGMIGWFLVAGAAVGLTVLLHWICSKVHPFLLFALHVVILYATVGFRQFSHAFSKIQLALAANDVDEARRILERWLQVHDPELTIARASQAEVCRLAISHAIVQSHRHVFGPLFWYILLPGPIGPVLYRVAEYLTRAWPDVAEPYTQFARDAYRWIDWIPLRLSITGFAIVGNFEDAVYCWRGASGVKTTDPQRDLLLAAGGGALGLRIADPKLEAQWSAPGDAENSFDWAGADPDPAGLRSSVGLVWRAVLLWISVFAMMTMATWLGR